MLLLTLILLFGPVDGTAARPFALPNTGDGPVTDVRIAPPDGSTQRLLSGRCEALLHRVSPSNQPAIMTQSTTFSVTRPVGEPRVRMYHLLERTIDGCRVPVIAIDHLPEADRAIGRNLGRFVTPR